MSSLSRKLRALSLKLRIGVCVVGWRMGRLLCGQGGRPVFQEEENIFFDLRTLEKNRKTSGRRSPSQAFH